MGVPGFANMQGGVSHSTLLGGSFDVKCAVHLTIIVTPKGLARNCMCAIVTQPPPQDSSNTKVNRSQYC
eukprot:1193495-Prorocentrum_minimum.AAC.4